ncbi:spermidine synthase [Leptospira langatensis]|uniref:Polyamine aminopropyltransferase n=2 Tax=Leptospira langatensis TaxID=2484983 RepID=A0A5F1ZSJ8_9LEPT|nr:spermidine synthase [Leptospira langatensis]TGL40762.1 spermidine synthase [Leptospira langatensis]
MEIDNRIWVLDYVDKDEMHFYRKTDTYFSGKTASQDVDLVELPAIGQTLIVNGELQSAANDEYIYHEALVHPACLLNSKLEDVLIIGGGEGATLREVVKYSSVRSVTMVDIDKELVSLFSQTLNSWHKGSFQDKRAKLVFQDGRKFLEKTQEKYDVIILDLPTYFAEKSKASDPIQNLYSKQFYSICSSHLKKGGLLVTQASELTPLDWNGHALIRRTLARNFRSVISYSGFVPSFYTNWGFLLASQEMDLEKIGSSKIDALISKKRIGPKLSFFDGLTFVGMRSLSKELRKNISKKGNIILDDPSVIAPLKKN